MLCFIVSDLITAVLSGSPSKQGKCFSVDPLGVELLNSGCEHLDAAYVAFRERIIPIADDCVTPDFLNGRIAGLGYVLRYVLSKGSQDPRFVELVWKFPPSLRSAILNAASAMNANAKANTGRNWLWELALEGQNATSRPLQDAAARYLKSMEEQERLC